MQLSEDFLISLGGLHDCTLTALRLSFNSKSAEFYIEDMYSNFIGLPEYRGPVGAKITLHGMTVIEAKLDFGDNDLKIFEIEVARKEDGSVLNAKFWPHGNMQIGFSAAEFQEI